MELVIHAGTTGNRRSIRLVDATTGQGKTALAFNTAGLTAAWSQPGAAPTSITLVTNTVGGAFASGGFVQVDAVKQPGVYQFDIPDTAVATGPGPTTIIFTGAGILDKEILIDLPAYDPNSIDKNGYALSATGMALVPGYV